MGWVGLLNRTVCHHWHACENQRTDTQWYLLSHSNQMGSKCLGKEISQGPRQFKRQWLIWVFLLLNPTFCWCWKQRRMNRVKLSSWNRIHLNPFLCHNIAGSPPKENAMHIGGQNWWPIFSSDFYHPFCWCMSKESHLGWKMGNRIQGMSLLPDTPTSAFKHGRGQWGIGLGC